jgi:hypothetical protein
MNAEQLPGGWQLKFELFECLLGCAARCGLDGASVCSLVVAFAAGFPLGAFCVHIALKPGGCSKAHPVDQLLQLPGLDALDAEAVCTMAMACIHAAEQGELLEKVLRLPAAAGLSVEHIRQLALACVLHHHRSALWRVLRHPAAAGSVDAEVEHLTGLMRRC